VDTTFTLICTNASGSASDSRTIFVAQAVTPPPSFLTASCAASPTVARLGQLVTIAAGSNGGTLPHTYTWSGDISGTGQVRQVTFSSIGTKVVTLHATDAAGRTAQGSCIVNVISAPIVKPSPIPVPVPPSPPPTVTLSTAEVCATICPSFGYVRAEDVYAPTQALQTPPVPSEKTRSLFASLLLDKEGQPSTMAWLLFLMLVILVVLAFGTAMYARVRSARPPRMM
jgi:hypothetical protein